MVNSQMVNSQMVNSQMVNSQMVNSPPSGNPHSPPAALDDTRPSASPSVGPARRQVTRASLRSLSEGRAGVHRGQLGEEGGNAWPGAALELREELHGARL
jgi:hypothetical protein